MAMKGGLLGLEITELRLGPPGIGGSAGGGGVMAEKSEKKRVFSDVEGGGGEEHDDRNSSSNKGGGGGRKVKNQVVGWPPVCSYRRRSSGEEGKKMYVKVSMDGAPYLRKIDLSVHKDYFTLLAALHQLFDCSGIGEALKDAESTELVPIYEDKDADWMLVGDVPWGMFIESCKRLRIMKRSDAKVIGLHAKNFLKDMAKQG